MPKTNTPQTHDFTGLDDWYQAFVGGVQTDSNGNAHNWIDSELDEIVANTKKRIEKNLFSGPPMVVGHPKSDAPAYGWHSDVKRDGKIIYLKGATDRINDAFAKGVENGAYPNRSVRIGKGKDGYYLRHVGFLGAAPPAVEMDPVYSASTDDECFDYSMDAYTPGALVRQWRRLRDFFIEQFGLDKADQVLPDYEIDSLNHHVESIIRSEDGNPVPSFSDGATGASHNDFNTGDDDVPEISKADHEKALKAERDKTAAAQAERDAERKKNRKVEFQAFVDKLECDPAMTEGAVEYLCKLAETEEQEFEFSAGDNTKKTTMVDYFQAHLKSLKPSVATGEHEFEAAADGDDAERKAVVSGIGAGMN